MARRRQYLGCVSVLWGPRLDFPARGSDPQRPSLRPADKFSGVASPSALELALDTLAVESQYQKAAGDEQRARLRYLEAQFGKQWGGIGSVAEAFAKAWKEAGERQNAVTWYEKAVKANDGTASMKAVEQLRDLQVHLAWAVVKKAIDRRDESRRRLDQARRGRRPTAVESPAAKRELDNAYRDVSRAAGAARRNINETIKDLQKLAAVQTSSERESLLGSAYKRLAMVEWVQGRAATESVRNMARHYGAAERLARAGNLSDLFYPALNRMAAELVLNVGRRAWKGFDPLALSAVRQSLETKLQNDPDFWSAVGRIELHVYEALAGHKLASTLGKLQAEFEDLHSRVAAPSMWGSVYEHMQFVLAKDRSVRKGEKEAADKMLKRLRKLAAYSTTQTVKPLARRINSSLTWR